MKFLIEMSNKMKKYFIVCLILISGITLSAFSPTNNDFVTPYQYELYKSWLRLGNFKTNFPSFISEDKIIKKFRDKNNEEITVEYDWKDHKIFNQKEKLRFTEKNEVNNFIESLIYRLNCDRKIFFFDYLNASGVILKFGNFQREQAADSLWKCFADKRIHLANLQIEKIKKGFSAIISEKNGIRFSLDFPPNYKIPNWREMNISLAPIPISKPKPKKTQVPETKILKPKKAISPPQTKKSVKSKTSNLENYIAANYRKMQTKELLQNKVSDVSRFIKREFPHHRIVHSDNEFTLKIQPFQGKYRSDLILKVHNNSDGIEIFPDLKFSLQNKILKTKSGDDIDLSKLSEREIEKISPFLGQLICEHRALGTKLLNFFLIHDRVSTSLVVNGEKRQFYEIYSYANLLLLLNKFWQKRVVYFNLRDVKKINGCIEFKGYLFAVEPESEKYDFAEIRFRLDKNYQMDLIMMFLYPQEQLKG